MPVALWGSGACGIGNQPSLPSHFETMREAAAMQHTSNDTLSELLPTPEYWVWSERECRWVAMTFDEHRASLARPDLDPAEFTSDAMAS